MKTINKPEYEHFHVEAPGFEPAAVLVNVNHDNPTSFAEREYRELLKAQGVPSGHIHHVRSVSYGTDGVQL